MRFLRKLHWIHKVDQIEDKTEPVQLSDPIAVDD